MRVIVVNVDGRFIIALSNSVWSHYMSSLTDYLTLKGQLAKLEGDSATEKEISFLSEFVALKDRYDFTCDEVIRLMRPGLSFDHISSTYCLYEFIQANIKFPDKPRSTIKILRRYRNPYTGEVVETRGSNHNRLKEWKKKYGLDAVTSWREL